MEIPLIRSKETEKSVFSRFCKTVKMIEEERLLLRDRLQVRTCLIVNYHYHFMVINGD